MEYITAMKIQKRMLGLTEDRLCHGECDICPFHKCNTGQDMTCDEFQMTYPEIAERILAAWNEENPPKTRFQVFLDAFPKAQIDPEDGTPTACTSDVWREVECLAGFYDDNGFYHSNCRECWHSPVE